MKDWKYYYENKLDIPREIAKTIPSKDMEMLEREDWYIIAFKHCGEGVPKPTTISEVNGFAKKYSRYNCGNLSDLRIAALNIRSSNG